MRIPEVLVKGVGFGVIGGAVGGSVGFLGGHLVRAISPTVNPVAWGFSCGLIPLISSVFVTYGLKNRNFSMMALGVVGAYPIAVVTTNLVGFNVTLFQPLLGYLAGGTVVATAAAVGMGVLTALGCAYLISK